MEEQDDQPANHRRRRNDEEEEGGRNIRARPNRGVVQRPEPFQGRVPIEAANVRFCPGGQRLPLNYSIRSLQSFMMDGPEQKTGMLFVILSITASDNTSVQQRGFGGGRGQVKSVQHTRKLTLMCVNSEAGANTAIIFNGNGNTPRLMADLDTRDNGALRPGSLVLLLNVPRSDRTLPDGTTPILAPTRPLQVVNSNFDIVQRPVVTEGISLNGFVLHSCDINLKSISFLDTPCGGDLCDQQSIVSGGVQSKRCACVQMKLRRGVAVVVYDVELVLEDGSTVPTQLCSKWFSRNYVFTGPFAAGTSASTLEDFMVTDRIYDAAVNVFNLVNDNGGWMVFGWTKRGEIQDQAVDQPGNGLPHNASKVTVEAGTLNYHVTRIDPMHPGAIDLDTFNDLRVDVVTGLRPGA